MINREESHYTHLFRKKTRIISTVTSNITLKKLSAFIKKGSNMIRCHMGYQDHKVRGPKDNRTKILKKLGKIRKKLESQLDINIPLIVDLKGYTVRFGKFKKPEVHVKAGEEFRIFNRNWKLIGNEHYAFCDLGQWFDQLKPGDRILLDYGRHHLKVLRKESYQEAIKAIKKVGKVEKMQRNRSRFTPVQTSRVSLNKLKRSQTVCGSNINLSKSSDGDSEGTNSENGSQNSFSNRFKNLFEDEDIEQKSMTCVVVCEVQESFMIRSHTPVYIQQGGVKFVASQIIKTTAGRGLSAQDLNFVDRAISTGVDFLTIPDVQSKDDFTEVSQMTESMPNIKLLAKIQNPKGLKNIEEIIDSSDGIMLSRNCLANFIPEHFNHEVKMKVINMCKKKGKMVFIKGQLFESMLTGRIPTCAEVNDVNGLVNANVDGIVLVRESMYGDNPLSCVQMLTDICMKAEQRKIEVEYKRPFERFEVDFEARRQSELINKSTLSACVATACRMTKIALILCITETGDTLRYLSAYDYNCPVLALCCDTKVARFCIGHRGAFSIDLGTLIGSERVIEKAKNYLKEKKIVNVDDTLVIIMGSVENVPGMTNTLQIIKVD